MSAVITAAPSIAPAATSVGNSALNIAIFALFVVVTLAIVIRASRNNRTAAEYYAGGRAFSGRQNGIAIAGDYLSAASFLGIAGARLLYALVFYEQFTAKPLSFLAIWNGGLVWYGGLLAGLLWLAWWLPRHPEMKGFEFLDVLARAACLGLAIGWIAPLLAGDQFGKPTDVPWGVPATAFQDGTPASSAATSHADTHPPPKRTTRADDGDTSMPETGCPAARVVSALSEARSHHVTVPSVVADTIRSGARKRAATTPVPSPSARTRDPSAVKTRAAPSARTTCLPSGAYAASVGGVSPPRRRRPRPVSRSITHAPPAGSEAMPRGPVGSIACETAKAGPGSTSRGRDRRASHARRSSPTPVAPASRARTSSGSARWPSPLAR